MSKSNTSTNSSRVSCGWLRRKSEVDESEDDVANIGGGRDPPVLQHDLRHQAVSLESEIAACVSKLGSGNVTADFELRLTYLERGKDEQVSLFVEPRLADANPVHDAFAKCQLCHCYFLSAIEGKDL